MVAIAVILALLVISSSLTNLRFKTGYRLRFRREAVEIPDMSTGGFVLVKSEAVWIVFRTLIYSFLIISLAMLVLGLVFKQTRKRAIRALIVSLSFVIFLFIGWNVARNRMRDQEQQESPGSDRDYEYVYEDVVEPEEFNGSVSDTVAIIVSLLLVVLAGFIAYRIWNRVRNRWKTVPADLADEARRARDLIEAGADLKNTVLRCYYEMCRIADEQRNIRRQESMTTREFENVLLEEGLPVESVDRITRLFERVRYGSEELAQEEEQEALQCLSEISELMARADEDKS